jgi:membrane protein
VHWLVDPLLRFNLIDRSLALGAQAFSALIPLMIVLESAQPGQASMASDLIERFHLSGDAAEVVQEAFASTGDTTVTVAVGARDRARGVRRVRVAADAMAA